MKNFRSKLKASSPVGKFERTAYRRPNGDRRL